MNIFAILNCVKHTDSRVYVAPIEPSIPKTRNNSPFDMDSAIHEEYAAYPLKTKPLKQYSSILSILKEKKTCFFSYDSWNRGQKIVKKTSMLFRSPEHLVDRIVCVLSMTLARQMKENRVQSPTDSEQLEARFKMNAFLTQALLEIPDQNEVELFFAQMLSYIDHYVSSMGNPLTIHDLDTIMRVGKEMAALHSDKVLRTQVSHAVSSEALAYLRVVKDHKTSSQLTNEYRVGLYNYNSSFEKRIDLNYFKRADSARHIVMNSENPVSRSFI